MRPALALFVSLSALSAQAQDTFRYYQSADAGFGVLSPKSWEAAIRCTTETRFDNWRLYSVRFLANEPWQSGGAVKLYDQGSSAGPGVLLDTALFGPPAAPGWVEVDLSGRDIRLTAGREWWVSLDITSDSGEFPVTVGNNVSAPFYCDWKYEDGAWTELWPPLYYEWVIEAVVESTITALEESGAGERFGLRFVSGLTGGPLVFQLSLPGAGQLRLSLYDAAGRLAVKPFVGTISAGKTAVTLPRPPSGVYLAVAVWGDRRAVLALALP